MNGNRRIFYDIFTGNIIHEISRNGDFILPSIENEIKIYKVLSERNKDTFDYIELEYSKYAQDFAMCNGYRVNPETKELEFSYPDTNNPIEPIYQPPLSLKVKELEQQNTDLQLAIAEMAEDNEVEKTETQLAIAELAEIISGGAK